MSDSRLVRNSPDLQRLVSDGYTVRLVNGYLVVVLDAQRDLIPSPQR